MSAEESNPQISLTGSVALGTGVMIGAGIFALVGQVAALAGPWFAIAFVAGAAVAGVSSYAYSRTSSADPSSGGVAMILQSAYGPGVTAGTFSLFMFVSMVIAESLLARTFATYLLRPFGLQDSAWLVPAIGVAAIAIAMAINLLGNQLVERSATATAALKILGLVVLACAGLAGAVLSSGSIVVMPEAAPGGASALDVLAGVALTVLAYKGFTTITNQGSDIRSPERNIPRSITIALAICAALYLLITVSVASSLHLPQIIEAKNYALAEAADPLFGQAGIALTGVVAVTATLSGLVASLFSVSRLLAMLQKMGQVPRAAAHRNHQPLLITAGLAAVATVALDLSRIASVGLLLYLPMDIAIQWGVFSRLKSSMDPRLWIPALSLALNTTLLIAFVIIKANSDLLTVGVALAIAGIILASQLLVARRST